MQAKMKLFCSIIFIILWIHEGTTYKWGQYYPRTHQRRLATKCQSPQRYVTCGSLCQPTCQNTRPTSCQRGCSSRTCICPRGMVQPDENTFRCILPSNCPRRCPSPQRHVPCASLCQPTCQNPIPASCRRGCSSRTCICPRGMVQPDEDIFTCIFPSDCPSQCEAPKVHTECASRCPPTCLNPKPLVCIRACDPWVECICPSDYVQRDKRNTTCIKLEDCPGRCPSPQRYVTCGSLCQPTCQNPKPTSCQRGCSSRTCLCPRGMVQPDEDTFTCIFPSDCPSQCEAPKVHTECASRCPPTCLNPKPLACTRGCDPTVECICPPDYVQRDSKDTTCIKLEDCPGRCPSPQRYVTCGSLCQPTCQNPKPMSCRRGCSSRTCICPRGMVQPDEDTFTCIFPSDCPFQCEAPKVHTECASRCPPTCLNPKPLACIRACDPWVECICPPDYVQRDKKNTTCIRLEDCPDCGHGKITTRCASGCPATCVNQNPVSCTKPCRPNVNCECQSGMVQRSLEDDTCLWPYQCDK